MKKANKKSGFQKFVADELEKLKEFREDNFITEDEFKNLKNKVITS